jgi:2-phospho-L-lactate transferase/gluconeogenesis factor (CofD/UPF0052 family)
MPSIPIYSVEETMNLLDRCCELNMKDKFRLKDHRLQCLMTDAQYLALREEEIINGLRVGEFICIT